MRGGGTEKPGVGGHAVKVGVVDIGTNSVRLLVTDGDIEHGRWVEVTGLGQGVDETGQLDSHRMDVTLRVLRRFGETLDEHQVERRLAIATSASRDASNREVFFDMAENALGVRPTLISGEMEARYAFRGAVTEDLEGPIVVSDIGGGSTEFVTETMAVSIDIGSVRLTERALTRRPADPEQMRRARHIVADLFEAVSVGPVETLVGVAGTWTSLSAIGQHLPAYDPLRVHGHIMSRQELDGVVGMLATKTIAETAAIPSLDPRRAPVILAGGVVATGVMERLGAGRVLVSEADSLDGAAAVLLAIP